MYHPGEHGILTFKSPFLTYRHSYEAHVPLMPESTTSWVTSCRGYETGLMGLLLLMLGTFPVRLRGETDQDDHCEYMHF